MSSENLPIKAEKDTKSLDWYVNHSTLKDGAWAKGIDPLARPIDKGSYMVLESPIPFAFFEIFAENVHAAIDVSIDKASVRRAVQASLDTLSAVYL